MLWSDASLKELSRSSSSSSSSSSSLGGSSEDAFWKVSRFRDRRGIAAILVARAIRNTIHANRFAICKLHFARFTPFMPLQTRSSVFLPRPLTPLHSPVLARPCLFPRPILAQSSPGLARPSPTLFSSNLAVKTGKKEIFYSQFKPLFL